MEKIRVARAPSAPLIPYIRPWLSSKNFQEISRDTKKQKQGASNNQFMYPFSGSSENQSVDLTFSQMIFSLKAHSKDSKVWDNFW